MSYQTGDIVEALTYNAFAAKMNEIYFDTHSNATSLPNAGYGYGQPPPLVTTLAPGDLIAAVDWRNIFQLVRNTSIHQGTALPFTLPPVGSPLPGDLVTAISTQANVDAYLALLKTNSFNLGVSQTGLISETPTSSNGQAWTNTITYTFSVDFGSWNNARYFFNSGGTLQFTASNSGVTPDEVAFQNQLALMSPFRINWIQTQPRTGGNEVTPPQGFYALAAVSTPTAYQLVYQEHVGSAQSPHYANNFITVEVKFAGAPGTSGRLDFRIRLNDFDTFITTKTGNNIFTIQTLRSLAPVPYPGAFTYIPGSFTPTI
jgi:hypothetical protein